MKLQEALNIDLYEIPYTKLMILTEEGEGARWNFRYPDFKVDPAPDVLLLGSYVHPNTKNELVGGINLHYLNGKQIKNLQRVLPDIMHASNLYSRYWIGRRLLPDVFNNFYRTYKSDKIHIVSKDTMYPKYGKLKAAKQFIGKKLSNLFKSKQQKELESQPKYPSDISDLDTNISQILKSRKKPEQPAATVGVTPGAKQDIHPTDDEMQLAQNAYKKYQGQKTPRGPEPYQPIVNPPATSPEADQLKIADPVPQKPSPQQSQQDNQVQQQQAEIDRKAQDTKLAQAGFQRDLKQNQEDLEETFIRFYSPIKKKYITESYVIRR